MPQINLLAPGLGPRKQESKGFNIEDAKDPKRQFQEISKDLILYSSICFGVFALIWVIVFSVSSGKARKLKQLKKEVDALAIDPKDIEKLKSERVALEKKVRLIDTLSSRQFYYFRKLELIADLVPDGVWINDVRSQAKSRTSGDGIVLTIKGTAVADRIVESVNLIEKFYENIKNNKEFSSDFSSIELNIAKGTVGNRDVMTFDMVCKTN